MRGAWIEIAAVRCFSAATVSLPVRGAWIEIGMYQTPAWRKECRSPCGERGLKYFRFSILPGLPGVAPRAGSVD